MPRSVEPFTLDEGERLTGVPAEMIRKVAHAYARADRAQICWTLGITEHHTAVDNVLCADQPRPPDRPRRPLRLGLNPLRGQNNVQGGGDMGAIPNKLPGLPGHRARSGGARRASRRRGTARSLRSYGWHLTQMFHGMERGELRTLYVIGENPAQSEADVEHARQLLAEPRLPRSCRTSS